MNRLTRYFQMQMFIVIVHGNMYNRKGFIASERRKHIIVSILIILQLIYLGFVLCIEDDITWRFVQRSEYRHIAANKNIVTYDE